MTKPNTSVALSTEFSVLAASRMFPLSVPLEPVQQVAALNVWEHDTPDQFLEDCTVVYDRWANGIVELVQSDDFKDMVVGTLVQLSSAAATVDSMLDAQNDAKSLIVEP